MARALRTYPYAAEPGPGPGTGRDRRLVAPARVAAVTTTPPGSGARSRTPRLSVCVVTYERPDFLSRCLAGLGRVAGGVDEIVVVDASSKDGSASVDGSGSCVRYVWAPQLAGWMTRSRNEALRWVTGDIIAFVDDDVVVSQGWADALRAAFADPAVGAVAGRTLNRQPGEDVYPGPIGRLLPDGRLSEGFAASVDAPVEVDHGIGANMSFRRPLLAELGGFRDDYPGTALREDTDIFLRARRLGRRTLYDPAAVVDHLPAPHVKGARFDTRYKLYGRRNHVVLLARDQGLCSPMLRRWIVGELRRIEQAGGPIRRVQRLGVTLLGIAWGLAAAARQARWTPMDPRRTGAQADQLRQWLGQTP